MADYFVHNQKKFNFEYTENELRQICESFGVKRLLTFGSVNTDEFRPDSDIDLLVTFDQSEDHDPFDRYFGLLENLENLFRRHVELVFEKKFRNPYFRESVNRTKKVIYEA